MTEEVKRLVEEDRVTAAKEFVREVNSHLQA
jgi:hypothetical protein